MSQATIVLNARPPFGPEELSMLAEQAAGPHEVLEAIAHLDRREGSRFPVELWSS